MLSNPEKLKASIILQLSLIEKGIFKYCSEIGLDIFECGIKNEYRIYYSKDDKNILIIDGCFEKDHQEVYQKVQLCRE